MRADKETILYRESVLRVVAVVDDSLFYSKLIPPDIKHYRGTLEDFLNDYPNYTYDGIE